MGRKASSGDVEDFVQDIVYRVSVCDVTRSC